MPRRFYVLPIQAGIHAVIRFAKRGKLADRLFQRPVIIARIVISVQLSDGDLRHWLSGIFQHLRIKADKYDFSDHPRRFHDLFYIGHQCRIVYFVFDIMNDVRIPKSIQHIRQSRYLSRFAVFGYEVIFSDLIQSHLRNFSRTVCRRADLLVVHDYHVIIFGEMNIVLDAVRALLHRIKRRLLRIFGIRSRGAAVPHENRSIVKRLFIEFFINVVYRIGRGCEDSRIVSRQGADNLFRLFRFRPDRSLQRLQPTHLPVIKGIPFDENNSRPCRLYVCARRFHRSCRLPQIENSQ